MVFPLFLDSGDVCPSLELQTVSPPAGRVCPTSVSDWESYCCNSHAVENGVEFSNFLF